MFVFFFLSDNDSTKTISEDSVETPADASTSTQTTPMGPSQAASTQQGLCLIHLKKELTNQTCFIIKAAFFWF